MNQLDRIEKKVEGVASQCRTNALAIISLDKSLAVHKVKTGWLGLLVGGISAVLVAVGAVLLKGCV